MSLEGKIHGSGNQRLFITPPDPFGELVLSVPTTLGFVGLEVLVLKGGLLLVEVQEESR